MEALPLFEFVGHAFLADQQDRGLAGFVDVAHYLHGFFVHQVIHLIDDQRTAGEDEFFGDLVGHLPVGLGGVDAHLPQDGGEKGFAGPAAFALHVEGAVGVGSEAGGKAFAVATGPIKCGHAGQVGGAADGSF